MQIKPSMKFSYHNSLEWVTACITVVLLLGVVQTFVIGQHFIIPTIILTFAILFGNITAYAFSGKLWAKLVIFWLYVILTCHGFFALFWAKKYREILGQGFEPTCVIFVLVLAFLLFKYKRSNQLLSSTTPTSS